MTKRDAKRAVCRWAAAALYSDRAIGAEFFWKADDGSERSEAEKFRISEALDELLGELEQRGKLRS